MAKDKRRRSRAATSGVKENTLTGGGKRTAASVSRSTARSARSRGASTGFSETGHSEPNRLTRKAIVRSPSVKLKSVPRSLAPRATSKVKPIAAPDSSGRSRGAAKAQDSARQKNAVGADLSVRASKSPTAKPLFAASKSSKASVPLDRALSSAAAKKLVAKSTKMPVLISKPVLASKPVLTSEPAPPITSPRPARGRSASARQFASKSADTPYPKTSPFPAPVPVNGTALVTSMSKVDKSKVNKSKSNRGDQSVTLPEGYRPADFEPFMGPMHQAYFRKKLQTWKEDIVKETMGTLQVLHDDTIQHADLADRATHEADRALELRARDRQRKLISKIDSALNRIEDGSYGYCEETGEPISLRRLDARPIATLSLEAQERHERRERVYRED